MGTQLGVKLHMLVAPPWQRVLNMKLHGEVMLPFNAISSFRAFRRSYRNVCLLLLCRLFRSTIIEFSHGVGFILLCLD